MFSFFRRRLLNLVTAGLVGFFLCTSIGFVAHAADGQDGAATETGSASSKVTVDGLYERAQVTHVEFRMQQTSSTGEQVRVFTVKFLSGPLASKTQEIVSDVTTNPYQLVPEAGDKIVIFMQPGTDANQWNLYIDGFDRRAALAWLVVLFVLTLVLLAGWQGLKVAFSILISIGLIGYVLIPAFLKGVNPVPLAIFLGGAFTLIASGLSTGWNRKAVVTAIGTMGGAIIAYLLSVVFVRMTHLSGLSSEEDRLFFEKNALLDPRGLLFAGIIIASVGVLEDVAVSIASGVSEVRRANPRLGFRELFTSGMVVGKDHMAALANTLVYAYVGGSLSSLLLYTQFGGSWLKFINFDVVVDELVRSLCGTIGLVFTVPITALLAAWWMRSEISDGSAPTVGHHHGHSHG